MYQKTDWKPSLPAVGGWREFHMKNCQNKERNSASSPFINIDSFLLYKGYCVSIGLLPNIFLDQSLEVVRVISNTEQNANTDPCGNFQSLWEVSLRKSYQYSKCLKCPSNTFILLSVFSQLSYILLVHEMIMMWKTASRTAEILWARENECLYQGRGSFNCRQQT